MSTARALLLLFTFFIVVVAVTSQSLGDTDTLNDDDDDDDDDDDVPRCVGYCTPLRGRPWEEKKNQKPFLFFFPSQAKRTTHQYGLASLSLESRGSRRLKRLFSFSLTPSGRTRRTPSPAVSPHTSHERLTSTRADDTLCYFATPRRRIPWRRYAPLSPPSSAL